MSDELEKKRQEKVSNFKLNFNADGETETEPSTDSENGEISSNSAQGENSENDGQEIFENTPEPKVYTDISSGDEMTEYGNGENAEEVVVDKRKLRRAKRIDKKRRKMKAKKNRIIFRTVWAAMVVFAAILLGEFIMVGVNDLLAVGREEENSVSVTVPKDATIDEIADILYKNGIINNEEFFKLYAKITKSTTGFTQGTFEIATNKDYLALIDYMQSDRNRTDVVTIQFTEGMTINQYARLLENNNVCNSEDFLSACNSDRFDEDYEFIKSIKNADKRYYKLEGYLFPDTYDFYVGENIDDVVRKFLANYRRKIYQTKTRVKGFEKKVTIEQRAEAIGMSMEDVITLASLIQAEAANERDMYYISSILHNRLDTIKNDGVNEYGESGFKLLQLDSTVFYPYASESDVPISVRSTYESKYSTYKYEGLPAGGICNPGMAAIEAAVSPAKTDYYYFCHKAATGEEPAVAYYASTMSEHLYNQEIAGLFDE